MVLIIAVFSLITGSFMNNVISHFSNKSEFDLWRSHCMCGEKILTALELVPIVSFIAQRGKCNYCDKKMSVRYPMIEIFTIAIGIIFYLKYEFSYMFFLTFCTSCLLLCVAAVDYYAYVIPNMLVMFLLFVSLIKAVLFNTEFLLNLFISLLLVALLILLNNTFDKIKNKEVIGYGDIKLLTVINLFFGYQLFFLGLWFSALIAIPGFYLIKLFSMKHSGEMRVPFGFFLSIGFIIISIFDEKVLPIYYHLIGV